MIEAIIGLAGVVIGGIIGVSAQVFAVNIENKRWKKERVIEELKFKRNDLDKKYNEDIVKIENSLTDETVDVDVGTNVKILFPKNVLEAWHKLLDTKGKDKLTKQYAYFDLVFEMKKSLSEIDNEIKSEINK